MPKQERSQINVRADAKTLYLLELACRATGKSQSEIARSALDKIFADISPYPVGYFEGYEDKSPLSIAEIEEAKSKAEAKRREESLAKNAELLWAEHPFRRMQILNIPGFSHLVTPAEHKIWRYLFSRSDLTFPNLKGDKVLDTEKVMSLDWDRVVVEAEKWKEPSGY